MKKTLIALVGAVLLLGVVLFLDHRRDAAHQAEKFAFDTAQKSGVNYVRVVLQKDTAVLQRINGQWVTAPDGFPVDTAKINKGLTYLTSLQNKEIVSSNPSRLLEYGLDTNQAKHVEWRTAGGGFKFVLGKTSGTDYSSTYWKWEDKPDVYSTPGNITWDIPSRSSDWKDRNLFKVESKDVRSIQVDWRDSVDQPVHYRLEALNDSNLILREPDSAAVRKADANNLLNMCGQFTIDDFVAPGDTDAAHARLDTPMVSIKIGLKNGKSYELHGGRTFSAMVYTQHPSRKDIVKIASFRFKAFEKRPYELMSDSVQAKAAMQRLP